MDADDLLNTLLQIQLASDSAAVSNLPYVLESLNFQCFLTSHLQKWTARVNSLLRSKDAGARWAGLCLAHRTSFYSKEIMIEYGHSWIGVAIPILTVCMSSVMQYELLMRPSLKKQDVTPILKAATNLCRIIFTAAIDVPEFQRQVSIPNVAKFSAVLLALLETETSLDSKVGFMTRRFPINDAFSYRYCFWTL